MTDLSPGKRLRGKVSSTEIIVVRPPAAPVELSCGGQPMTADLAAGAAGASTTENDTVLGKRYVDKETGLEVLCTKAGPGVLSANGRQLTLKAPNALPASD
ncbi:hypothetical protein MRAB57_2978 [Mycobacterium rhizamassiliense]|uniref:Uncharacterized protein n=2 Tax=Mycobacterium TaxID=1763 RepID=A0A2U3PB69_9MYCO|nr:MULTISPECIES: hypothetical protein [Mycobacterium]SPM35157.1 hypothetical protein MRAB57_2978 [Mycobacterium rhizamassiliense]SPM40986.1 hypothetical protein MNAB215_3187 [Mycobacterium numidiamassiliense]